MLIGHYTIKQKCIVVLQVSEGMHEFGCINEVICFKDETFLLLKMTVKRFMITFMHML
jgi:hypothetical protein